MIGSKDRAKVGPPALVATLAGFLVALAPTDGALAANEVLKSRAAKKVMPFDSRILKAVLIQSHGRVKRHYEREASAALPFAKKALVKTEEHLGSKTQGFDAQGGLVNYAVNTSHQKESTGGTIPGYGEGGVRYRRGESRVGGKTAGFGYTFEFREYDGERTGVETHVDIEVKKGVTNVHTKISAQKLQPRDMFSDSPKDEPFVTDGRVRLKSNGMPASLRNGVLAAIDHALVEIAVQGPHSKETGGSFMTHFYEGSEASLRWIGSLVKKSGGKQPEETLFIEGP